MAANGVKDQLSETIMNSAQGGGNNIMINTGPVTSHTVLLNLFPATEHHVEVEKKKK